LFKRLEFIFGQLKPIGCQPQLLFDKGFGLERFFILFLDVVFTIRMGESICHPCRFSRVFGVHQNVDNVGSLLMLGFDHGLEPPDDCKVLWGVLNCFNRNIFRQPPQGLGCPA